MSYQIFETIVDNKPIMALDLGKKNIGIAFSDQKKMFAIPHSVIIRKKKIIEDVDLIHSLYVKHDSCLLVIGMPYDHVRDDGWIEEINKFACMMEKKYQIPLYFQDESFTTVQAEEILANFSTANKKKSIDKISAYCILEHTLSLIKFYYNK